MANRADWQRAGAIVFTLLGLAGCGAEIPPPVEAATRPASSAVALASLGAQQVDAEELKALLAQVQPQVRQQLQENRAALDDWLRVRLTEKALLEQAGAQQWEQRPEVRQAIDEASRQIILRSYMASVSKVPEGYPSAAEVQAAYDAQRASLMLPARYRVSQIFIAASAGDEAAAKRVQALYRKAQGADADFAELARDNSDDKVSAQRGGEIGLLPLDQLLPAVRPALQQMKDGAISEPLRTAEGFHILKLLGREAARVATLDEVRVQLVAALRQQRQEQIAQAYLAGLVNDRTLSIDGAAVGKVLGEKP